MGSLEKELVKAGGGPVAVCCLKIFKYFTCYRILRFLLPMAVMVSVTYFYLWIQFPLDHDNRMGIAAATGIIVGVFTCTSLQMLCVFCLSFPTMGMRIGQQVIFLFISWTVYSVPMNHMVQNLNSTSKAFQCFVKDMENDANQARMAIYDAQAQIRSHLIHQIEKLARIHTKVDNLIKPIRDETKKLDFIIQSIKTGLTNAHTNCTATLKTASNGCNTIVSSFSSMCKKVNVFGKCEGLNFLPCKMDTICDVLLMLSNLNITSLELTVTELTNNLKLKINSTQTSNVSSSVESGVQQIANNTSTELFNVFKIYFDLHYLGQLFMYFTICYIPISCYILLCNLRLGKNSCFQTCFCKCGCSKTKTRTRKLCLAYRFVKAIFVSMIIFAVVLFLEYAVYTSQVLAKKAANVKLDHTSNVAINFNVEGGSLFGDFVKDILGGVNINKTITFDVNPSNCLPNPIKPANMYAIFYLLLAYAMIFVFLYFERRLENMRLRVAKYFYPDISISTKARKRNALRRSSASSDISDESSHDSINSSIDKKSKSESFLVKHILKRYKKKSAKKATNQGSLKLQDDVKETKTSKSNRFSILKNNKTLNRKITENTKYSSNVDVEDDREMKRTFFPFLRAFKNSNQTVPIKNRDNTDAFVENENIKSEFRPFLRYFKFKSRKNADNDQQSNISDKETEKNTVEKCEEAKNKTDLLNLDKSINSSVLQDELGGLEESNNVESLSEDDIEATSIKALSLKSFSSFKTAYDTSSEGDSESDTDYVVSVTKAIVHSNDIC